MSMNSRETVGKVAQDLIIKDEKVTPTEQMMESLSDYDKNIYEAIDRGKKDFAGDFFVVVLTKREKLLPNVLRNYFTVRLSCPTPNYDQTVYQYIHKNDALEFLWTIPDRYICNFIKEHCMELPPEQKQLIQFVLDFADGTLMQKAMVLNKEIV